MLVNCCKVDVRLSVHHDLVGNREGFVEGLVKFLEISTIEMLYSIHDIQSALGTGGCLKWVTLVIQSVS